MELGDLGSSEHRGDLDPSRPHRDAHREHIERPFAAQVLRDGSGVVRVLPCPVDDDDRVDTALTHGSIDSGVPAEQWVALESSSPTSIGVIHDGDRPKSGLLDTTERPKRQLGVLHSADEGDRRSLQGQLGAAGSSGSIWKLER